MSKQKQLTLSFDRKRLTLKAECILDKSAAFPKKKVSKPKPTKSLSIIMDCGQSDLKSMTCKSCGMTYMYKDEQEEKLHQKFCKSQTFIEFKGWKKEKVVYELDEERILEVSTCEPKVHLKKIEEIRQMIDKELGFPEIQGDYKTYLYIADKKVVGCLIVERITKGFIVENNEILHNIEKKAVCGVSRVWVHPLYRRKGIATKLLDSCKNNFIYGYKIPEEEIAFSQPTDDGKFFASSQNPEYLVYK